VTIDKRSVIRPVQPGRDLWSLLELKRYRCFFTLFIEICHIPESLCSQSTSSMAAPTPSTTPPALAAQRDGPVVLLSYAREDRDFVLRVAEALRLNGLKALGDWQLLRGESYERQLEDLQLGADVLVFVLSPDSVRSAPCRAEVERAAEQKKRILPVVFRDVSGLRSELPQTLSSPQWTFLRPEDDFNTGMQGLVEAIHTDFALMPDHRRILQAAEIWLRNNRSASYLLRKDGLNTAEDWLTKTGVDAVKFPKPTVLQLEYIRASRSAQTRRSRITTALVSVVAIVTAVLAVAALVQRSQARHAQGVAEKKTEEATQAQRVAEQKTVEARQAQAVAEERTAEATRQRNLAFSRELAVTSNSQLQVDPELSVLLAVEGIKASPTPQAQDALRRALLESHVRARFQHAYPVRTAVFEPGGSRILTASFDKAQIWEPRNGKVAAEFQRPNESDRIAVFSPAGRELLAAGDRTARLWDIASGKALFLLQGHSGPIISAAFSNDGKSVITVGRDDGARVWNVATGEKVAELRTPTDGQASPAWTADGRRIIPEVFTGILRVAVSTDDQWIVTGSRQGTVYIWDRVTGNLSATLKGHTTHVDSVAFSPDGKRVLTASHDRTARLWDVTTGRQLAQLNGHSGPVIQAGFSVDGRRIATASWDGTARLWDANSGALRAELRGHTAPLNSVAFSTNGRYLVTTSSDSTARVWEAASGAAVAVLRGHTAQVNSAYFSPSGATILTASDDRTARLWALDVVELKGHASGLLTAGFSPDGRLVATGALDGATRIWASDSGAEIRSLPGHAGPVSIVGFDRAGKRLVSGSFDMTARVWNLSGNASPATLPTNAGPLNFATFSPDGELVATPGSLNKVWIWNASTGQQIAELPANDNVYDAVFSSDGRYLVTVGQKGMAYLWGTSSWPKIAEFSKVRYAGFSPDAKYLGTEGEKSAMPMCYSLNGARALLGNCAASNIARWIRPHMYGSGGALQLRLDRDGVHVLETGTGQSVLELRGDSGAINSAAFSPDGKRIVTASEDGTARIYACDICVPLEGLLSIARNRVTRELTAEERKKYLHEKERGN